VGTWLEPCAGDGRIIETVNRYHIDKVNARHLDLSFPIMSSGIHWHAWDIQRQYEEPLLQLGAVTRITDIFDQQPAPDPVYDIVITNPPYNIAMDVLLWSRQLAPIVVLLLRRNFIGSAKRHPYLIRNMPDEYLLPNRPSFIWSHRYTLGCSSCGRDVTLREKVPAGQRARARGTVHPGRTDHCSQGSLRIVNVETSSSDSCEYCWCVWTPESGPVGSTRMLALTPPEEMALR
jgi:hypothetical protein